MSRKKSSSQRRLNKNRAQQVKSQVAANQGASLARGEMETSLTAESFSGPVPPPAVLAKYDLIVPGAAERILSMAESEAAHQHELEIRALEVSGAILTRGQRFALTIGLASLSVAALAIILGEQWAASIVGGSTILGLVSIFVTGRIFKPRAGRDAQ